MRSCESCVHVEVDVEHCVRNWNLGIRESVIDGGRLDCLMARKEGGSGVMMWHTAYHHGMPAILAGIRAAVVSLISGFD